MNRTGQFLGEEGIDGPLASDAILTFKGRGDDREVEVALAARSGIDAALVVVTGVARAVVLDL